MKKADKSSATIRNFDQLVSKFSENEILSLNAMIHVHGGGGDGEGNGGSPVIIIPKPPK
jgi:hypothetical protein